MDHNYVDMSDEDMIMFTQMLRDASVNHLLAHGQMTEDELQSAVRRWNVLGGTGSSAVIGKLKQLFFQSGESLTVVFSSNSNFYTK
jgi:hypothetical protein